MAAKEKEPVLTLSERERFGSVDTVQIVHQDGSVDFVDRTTLGGALHQMPEGYFHSVQFVGTVIVGIHVIRRRIARLMAY